MLPVKCSHQYAALMTASAGNCFDAFAVGPYGLMMAQHLGLVLLFDTVWF